jgi:hypothetical protein
MRSVDFSVLYKPLQELGGARVGTDGGIRGRAPGSTATSPFNR